MKQPKTKKCLIIEWVKLPRDIKDLISGWCGFNNDCLLPVRTEFEVEDYAKGLSSINEYYEEQSTTNGFEGSFDDFIEDYNLQFDVWMIRQGFNYTDIDKILIEVDW